MATQMDMGWMIGVALKFVADYQKSIVEYPNIHYWRGVHRLREMTTPDRRHGLTYGPGCHDGDRGLGAIRCRPSRHRGVPRVRAWPKALGQATAGRLQGGHPTR